MENPEQIAYVVVGALLSALLTYGIPVIAGYLRLNKQSQLFGSWLSAYRRYSTVTDRQNADWIEERVEVQRYRFRHLMFRSSNNPEIGDYFAQARLFEGDLLLGRWWYKSREAPGSGSFTLTVESRGQYMYGFYRSKGEGGHLVYVAWVLGKDRDSLARAKKTLSEATTQLQRPTTTSQSR